MMKGDGKTAFCLIWEFLKTRKNLIGNSIDEEKKKIGKATEVVNNTRRVVCYFYLRHVIDNLTFASVMLHQVAKWIL